MPSRQFPVTTIRLDMKTCRTTLCLLGLLALAACTREPSSAPETQEMVRFTITATAAETADAPEPGKTRIDPSDETRILWSPGEKITIIANNCSDCLTGENTVPAATASFSGGLSSVPSSYVVIYPFRDELDWDDSSFSAVLPTVQTGKAGGFSDEVFIEAGRSTTTSVRFKALCSGLRFKLTRSDIRSVMLSGNNGEGIAGEFQFSFDASGNPIAGKGKRTSVTLNAPDGGTFEAGKWYYIVTLPAVFSQGITLMLSDGSSIGAYRIDTPVTFSRGVFKNKEALDTAADWSATPTFPICYGKANSYAIMADWRDVQIDIAPYYTIGGRYRSDFVLPSSYRVDNVNSKGGAIDVELDTDKLMMTVKTGDTGAYVITLCDSFANQAWPILIWARDYSLDSEPLSNDIEALPPLGGQVYFQWGSPIPILLNHPDVSPRSPVTDLSELYEKNSSFEFVRVNSGTDWLSPKDDSLWGDGDLKTVWDPCPEGWRVPSWEQLEGLNEGWDLGSFPYLGYLGMNGTLQDEFFVSLYWTRSTQDEYAKSLYSLKGSGQILEQQNNARALALPVRCVKE